MDERLCLSEVSEAFKKASGREMSEKDWTDMFDQLKDIKRRKKAQDQFKSDEQIYKEIASEYAAAGQTLAKKQKYLRYLNVKKRLEMIDYLETNWDDKINPDIKSGIVSMIVGSADHRMGSRNSAAARQEAVHHEFLTDLGRDIEDNNLWDLFAHSDEASQLQLSEALYAINRKVKDPAVLSHIDPETKKLAEILVKHMEVARLRANRAGADVSRIDGYITEQSHDLYKMLAKGSGPWKDQVRNRLDFAKMGVDPANIERFLDTVYHRLASGVHLTKTADDSAFTGPKNIAKSMSQSRVLQFKSAKDWFEYNKISVVVF